MDVAEYLRRHAPGLYAVLRAMGARMDSIDDVVKAAERVNPHLAEILNKVIEEVIYSSPGPPLTRVHP